MLRAIFEPGTHSVSGALGLLFLRVGAGLMMFSAHGWAKITGFNAMSSQFPDPLGLGSMPSLVLAIFAEGVCSAAVILGIATRAAALPLLITMIVAALVVHGADPWAKKELPLLYATVFFALMFTGAGRYSIDGMLFGRPVITNPS